MRRRRSCLGDTRFRNSAWAVQGRSPASFPYLRPALFVHWRLPSSVRAAVKTAVSAGGFPNLACWACIMLLALRKISPVGKWAAGYCRVLRSRWCRGRGEGGGGETLDIIFVMRRVSFGMPLSGLILTGRSWRCLCPLADGFRPRTSTTGLCWTGCSGRGSWSGGAIGGLTPPLSSRSG